MPIDRSDIITTPAEFLIWALLTIPVATADGSSNVPVKVNIPPLTVPQGRDKDMVEITVESARSTSEPLPPPLSMAEITPLRR
jgi:hypothetical protein